tara:strand:+ start:47356 stop:47685 length:330 start_codon:yes stop_codon:yes gene_type:complete
MKCIGLEAKDCEQMATYGDLCTSCYIKKLESEANQQRYCFKKDDDGHWFLVPVEQAEEFERLLTKCLEYEHDSENEKDDPYIKFSYQFDKMGIDGGPYSYSFTNAEKIK